MQFEIDFAQVCELILLFSESQGSIAELGAFAMLRELAQKMLVVVRDYHLKDDSFIKLGPLQHLRLAHGEKSVFILNDDETGLVKNSIKGAKLDILESRLTPAIDDRFKDTKERTTFDATRRGHLIKMMVGFVQIFGGLTAAELVELCAVFDIVTDEADVDRLMLCAEAAEWVAKEQRGFNFYYLSLPVTTDALILKYQKKTPISESLRRKEYYREHWKVADPARFAGIVKFAGGKK